MNPRKDTNRKQACTATDVPWYSLSLWSLSCSPGVLEFLFELSFDQECGGQFFILLLVCYAIFI